MGYGDTVPATGFSAAGMTFEKASGDRPAAAGVRAVPDPVDVAVGGRGAKRDILAGWHGAWVEAQRQGRRGELEPNEVVQPGNERAQRQVPDIRVRHYFIRADDPAKAREVQALVRRLQRMDVKVRRLTSRSRSRDYTPYGRAPRAATLPAGTYWCRWPRRQKHWVQAMLNEDTYTPFPYFYDVTGWSQPLLFNVEGGNSGRGARRDATAPVRPLADPGGRGPRPTRRRSRCTHVAECSSASSPPAGCATCSTAGGCPTGS